VIDLIGLMRWATSSPGAPGRRPTPSRCSATTAVSSTCCVTFRRYPIPMRGSTSPCWRRRRRDDRDVRTASPAHLERPRRAGVAVSSCGGGSSCRCRHPRGLPRWAVAAFGARAWTPGRRHRDGGRPARRRGSRRCARQIGDAVSQQVGPNDPSGQTVGHGRGPAAVVVSGLIEDDAEVAARRTAGEVATSTGARAAWWMASASALTARCGDQLVVGAWDGPSRDHRRLRRPGR
jgi:hypothetical protein